MDAFHAQKWSARQTPPATASTNRGTVRWRQSRHSPVTTSRTATMTRENPSRQAAIATASALERRTSGPANDIPSTASASTQYGFADIKKKEPVRLSTGSFFRTTLLAALRFDQSHLGGGAVGVLEDRVVVAMAVRRVSATDAAVVAQQSDSSV